MTTLIHIKDAEQYLEDMCRFPLGKRVPDETLENWRHFSSNHGGNLLHLAISHGQQPLHQVALLLENGFDINKKDKEGRTPLTRIFSRKDPEAHDLLRFLLARGANPSCLSQNQLYPLAMACRSGRFHYLDDLLSYGANPHPQSDQKQTLSIWEWALSDFNSKSFPALQERLPAPPELWEKLLTFAIQKAFHESIEILWNKMGQPVILNDHSILFTALNCPKVERLLANDWIARWLEAGADETLTNQVGLTWMEVVEKDTRWSQNIEIFLKQRAEGNRRLLEQSSPKINHSSSGRMRL